MITPGKLLVFVKGLRTPIEVNVHRVHDADYKSDMAAKVKDIFHNGLQELFRDTIVCIPPHRIKRIEFSNNAPKSLAKGNRI
jgi:hypothetical protein